MDKILSLLKSEYGIVSESIHSAIGGFSAKAYHVKAVNGIEYFVKIYNKSLPTTRVFVERIDNYMPVLDWLAKSSALYGRILTPVPTKNRKYKAETDNEIYTVFLFVHGELPGIQGMTRKQTIELAETLCCTKLVKRFPLKHMRLMKIFLWLFVGN